jgi:DNA-binding response OmpR family regulator
MKYPDLVSDDRHLGFYEQKESMTPIETRRNSVRPTKIMIVDDYINLAKLLGTLLEFEGHEVLIATSAQDALAATADFRADFYIIDVELGRSDGRQLGKLLRKRPEGRNACFISITGLVEKNGIARSMDAGFDLHLVKPFEIDVLNRFIAIHKPAPENLSERS